MLKRTSRTEEYGDASNWRAWAVGMKTFTGRFRARKIVWKWTDAQREKQSGEVIMACAVMIRERIFGDHKR